MAIRRLIDRGYFNSLTTFMTDKTRKMIIFGSLSYEVSKVLIRNGALDPTTYYGKLCATNIYALYSLLDSNLVSYEYVTTKLNVDSDTRTRFSTAWPCIGNLEKK